MITCVEPVGAVRAGVTLARLGSDRAGGRASGFSAEGGIAQGIRPVAVNAMRKV
jgi:hypothetical protein